MGKRTFLCALLGVSTVVAYGCKHERHEPQAPPSALLIENPRLVRNDSGFAHEIMLEYDVTTRRALPRGAMLRFKSVLPDADQRVIRIAASDVDKLVPGQREHRAARVFPVEVEQRGFPKLAELDLALWWLDANAVDLRGLEPVGAWCSRGPNVTPGACDALPKPPFATDGPVFKLDRISLQTEKTGGWNGFPVEFAAMARLLVTLRRPLEHVPGLDLDVSCAVGARLIYTAGDVSADNLRDLDPGESLDVKIRLLSGLAAEPGSCSLTFSSEKTALATFCVTSKGASSGACPEQAQTPLGTSVIAFSEVEFAPDHHGPISMSFSSVATLGQSMGSSAELSADIVCEVAGKQRLQNVHFDAPDLSHPLAHLPAGASVKVHHSFFVPLGPALEATPSSCTLTFRLATSAGVGPAVVATKLFSGARSP